MAAVVDALASKLGGMLLDLAKDEVKMLLGVRGEITRMETKLGDLAGILADAERKRIRKDSAAERWVRELKDIMYDADDILDLCLMMRGEEEEEGGPRPITTPAPASDSDSGYCTCGCRCRCSSIPKLSCFRNPIAAHDIGRKIQALNQRLEGIASRSHLLGPISHSIGDAGDRARALPETSKNSHRTGSTFIQSDIVGDKIRQDTGKLVELLISNVNVVSAPTPATTTSASDDGHGVVVVAITGTGGIGKTTLARMVFDSNVVTETFDRKAWLSVNQNPEEIDILQRLVSALGGSSDGCSGDKDLLELALQRAVTQQQKLLLVMDDVWSHEVWTDLLRQALVVGASKCRVRVRVLVTTRNIEVARGMKANLHQVDKLPADDAWAMLKKKVIPNENDESLVNELEDIGKKIVEKCDGLPLAIKVVAGLLITKGISRGAWMNVYESEAWSVTGTNDDLNTAVYVSYEELHCELKQCFLYCSLIPKDELIKRGVIIQMWMAEGYIQRNDYAGGQLPEDLGQQYYEELISRNLLDPHNTFYGQSACTMHDVVRSFAQNIIKDEGSLISERQKKLNSGRGAWKLRQLSIPNIQLEWGGDLQRKQLSLRTLMLFGCPVVKWKGLWNNLSCLRVLELNNVNLAELPASICSLKHLRFLGLARSAISTIPEGIGNLKLLQCVDLMGARNISQLPGSILNLRKLRSLNFSGTKIASVPRGFGELQDLVTMIGFPTHSDGTADDGRCSLQELGPLSNLKMLCIEGLEKAPSGSVASKAALHSKSRLIDLKLTFTSNLGVGGGEAEQERMEEVLANLCPPTRIEELTISGYVGRRLPQWMTSMADFGSLRRLDLWDYACCKYLPNGLGRLPFLDCLRIKRAPSIQRIGFGRELVVSSSSSVGAIGAAFPRLIELLLEGMPGWREWEWQEHLPAMPALEKLFIDDCKLMHLPPGLSRQATQLRRLVLSKLSHLISVESFPSLVELQLLGNPKLERIADNPRLQEINIIRCPGMKELVDLPSLRSIVLQDMDADQLPEYLRDGKLNKLIIHCSLKLLKMILLRDASTEWGKIQHVHQLKVFGYELLEDTYKEKEHIFYTKEPYSFEN